METIKRIAQVIKNAGGTAYVVGGYVRDKVMGQPSKDIDVEVFGISPEKLESILEGFGKLTYCGKSYGGYKLTVEGVDIPYEFSIPRRERKSGKGHKDFEVILDPFLNLKDAAKRRDLTINALMYCPIDDVVIDLFDGTKDIEKGIIRHVDSTTFTEDPLRVLRVAQFHARFDFQVDAATKVLCQCLVDEMQHLSSERLLTEMEKMLVKAERPSQAFRFLKEIGVLEILFPELHEMTEVEQGVKYHPEGAFVRKVKLMEPYNPNSPEHKDRTKYKIVNGTVFDHTMLALDSVPMKDRRLDLMLAILCHDFGKMMVVPVPVGDDHVSFHGHAEEGEPLIRKFLGRITTEAALIESVVALSKYHMRPYELQESLNKKALRRLALKVNIDDLMVVHRADMGGNTQDTPHVEAILTMWQEVKNEIKPLIQGRHLIALGMTPGPHFGRILKQIFEAQLDDVFTTEEEGIQFVREFVSLHNDN